MNTRLQTMWMLFGAGLMLVALSGCPTGGGNGFLVFDADLSGDSEVPPVTTNGTGSSTITLDEQAGIASYTVSYSGLSDPVRAAHFHNAPTGQNGGIIINLTDDFTDDDDGFVQGVVSMTAAQIAELRAGDVYINLHTEANPDGEIRGQYVERP